MIYTAIAYNLDSDASIFERIQADDVQEAIDLFFLDTSDEIVLIALLPGEIERPLDEPISTSTWRVMRR